MNQFKDVAGIFLILLCTFSGSLRGSKIEASFTEVKFYQQVDCFASRLGLFLYSTIFMVCFSRIQLTGL